MNNRTTTGDDAVLHEARTISTVGDGQTTRWYNWRVATNCIIAGLTFGLFGYDNAFVSPLLSLPLFVEKYQGVQDGPAFLPRNLNLLVTVPLVAAAFGALLGAWLGSNTGRKRACLIGYVALSVPGSILQLFASNMAAMVCGRFINYLGISIVTVNGPLWLTETVPAAFRGRAIGFCAAGNAGVAVLATTLVWGTQTIDDKRQYMIPLAIQAALPAAFAFLTLFTLESPTWLLSRGRTEEAKANLTSLRAYSAELVRAEFTAMEAALENERETSSPRMLALEMFDKHNIKRTITAGAFLAASQVGGQILILTYSTVILVQSGVSNAFEITILIFCLQFLGVVVGPLIVDKFGRRPLALFGFALLAILDFAAGGIACAGLTTHAQQIGLVAVYIIFAFVNAITFQTIAFLIPAEVSTIKLREATMSWAFSWSYITAIITTFAVPQIISPSAGNLGAKTSLIFGGCMILTIMFTYFYLPETKGRTPFEIDYMYSVDLPMRHWKGYIVPVDTVVEKHYQIENKQPLETYVETN